MLGIYDYWLFVLSGIVLNLTPGQDTFSFLGNSLGAGHRAGIAAALGIAAGCIAHAVAAALGLSAILPKVALFFLAFLPQFIAPDSERKIEAFLLLGATFIAIGLAWCLVLAVGAGRFREILAQRPRAGTLLGRAAGAIFVALGLRLALHRA